MRHLAVFSFFLFCCACQPRMEHQGKLKTYSSTDFYADQSAARPLPDDVVAYHQPEDDLSFRSSSIGMVQLLNRGKERYEIFCSVCHGLDGRGVGMATLRGFPQAPSFLSAELKKTSLQDLVGIESQGKASMLGFKDRVSISDRWAIALYVRALQFSQSQENPR